VRAHPSIRYTGVASAVALLLIPAGGCAVYSGKAPGEPTVEIPASFTHQPDGGIPIERWWTEFKQPQLSIVIDRVVTNNLALRQAWARLLQSDAIVSFEGAGLYPQINLEGGGSNTKISGTTPGAQPVRTGSFDQYIVGAGLTYEIDLWKRIASQRQSAVRARDASREDVEAAALSLAGQTASLWFTLQEQQALRRLLGRQIRTSETILELLELRFQVSQATVLDVYQQRQQLAGTQAQVPTVDATMRTTWHRIQVLQGITPGGPPVGLATNDLSDLPPFPDIGSPASLIFRRPDLRSALLRMQAADYEVAAAVADRYPRLQLSLSYRFSAEDFAEVLDNETRSIAGNLLLPLLDGGRRRSVVDRRKAVVAELLAAFNGSFLTAMREVEDALVNERFSVERIDRLRAEQEAARTNLDEAGSRYRNGLSDYLPVITALQSLQNVEREVISAKANLLKNRVNLYGALGGMWTRGLVRPDLTVGDTVDRSKDS
jgi:NodT family efflux transporter outer membrane factor (OMF) lipoprotein